MGDLIGYYVHHQGNGHLARALAIAGHAPAEFTLIGTSLSENMRGVARLQIADDMPEHATTFDAYSQNAASLHYAPLKHQGIRQRVATVARWIETARPALIVCDVSVEIAMLARLMATPVIYIRLNGDRTDAAHIEAFRSAQALLAPFAEALDDADTPLWIREKTRYFAGITAARPMMAPACDVVLVVNGTGGAALDGDLIAQAAAAAPDFKWRVIGPVSPPLTMPTNLAILGWVENADDEVAQAAIVVGAAGDGLVNAVLAACRPFICLPQTRPYDEQFLKARRLRWLGVAVVIDAWPPADLWPGLLRRALALDPAVMARLHDPLGVQKSAAFIIATARQCMM